MGDTVTTMRFYEQIKREKRAKEKWNQKYLTAEQLELERRAEAAAIAEHAERTKPKKKLNERDAMLARLHAVELRPSTPEDADEEMEAEQGGAARKESTQRTYRMTAHQLARERIRQEVAATRERSCKMSHDLSLESQLNDTSPLLWAKFNAGARVPASAPSSRAARCPRPSNRRLLRRAGYKHPHAFPGTRTGLSTQHTTHIYNANAEGVAKWSARIEKPHNLSMDGFMKHAEKVVGLGEKPFGRMGPVGATHLKDHAEKFGRF